MKADRKKLELAMARACMNSADLPAAAGLPRSTVQNLVVGKSVRPATLGKVARALGVDPEDIIEKGAYHARHDSDCTRGGEAAQGVR